MSYMTDKRLEGLCDELTDVPVAEDTDMRTVLDEDWHGFAKGTDVEDIWRLFDKHHSKGVYWLMYERGKEEDEE